MDPKEEYHDPDYPETSRTIKQEPTSVSDEEKIARIKNIIRREFSNELEIRENEIMLIDQRMWTARRLLHRLRYALVTGYYCEQKLQATPAQLADDREGAGGQRRLHPSVRKLLGRRTADLDEIFRSSQRRALPRKDYSAMVQKRSAPAPASAGDVKDEAKSSAEETGLKRPRVPEPPAPAVLTLEPATRNKAKHRYRIIVGNTSRYAPGASAADRATHWWLLYVRGPRGADGSRVLRQVTVRLHASYAPHHTVRLRPPYRLARRGWGEFDARLELAFALPDRNPPAALNHTIRLDTHRTGLQTLGSETVVDVWLYSSPDMLQYAYVEPGEDETPGAPPAAASTPPAAGPAPPAAEPAPPALRDADGWTDFFTKDTTELDVDEMIIKPVKREREEAAGEAACDLPAEILTQGVSPNNRIMKYMDPTTGKIYYLEMDRKLDLTKVQEIVIDDTRATLGPVRSNGLRAAAAAARRHVDNDHCYCGPAGERGPRAALGAALARLGDVRAAVDYLLRRLPLEGARRDHFWRLDFAKRRNIEWSRAKLINRLVAEHLPAEQPAWRTKQILVYSRLHGHYPTRPDAAPAPAPAPADRWEEQAGVRRLYPAAADLCSLSLFEAGRFAQAPPAAARADSDEEVDVERARGPPPPPPGAARAPPPPAGDTLPAASEDERLRYLFIERKCADIGIELRNEDIGHGYQYSAVHCVLLSAVRSFAEELVRSALAERLATERPSAWPGSSTSRALVGLEHVYAAAGGARPAAGDERPARWAALRAGGSARLAVLCARALASRRKNTHAI